MAKVVPAPARLPRAAMQGRPATAPALLALTAGLVALVVLAGGLGAVTMSPGQVATALLDPLLAPLGLRLPWDISARDATILWQIRLPRVALTALVGAGLGISGAAMQGVVRNPLADPSIIGVSGGAALGAVGYLVLGAPLAAAVPALGPWLLPAAAFAGALGSTAIALRIARVDGRTSTVALLLGGVALAALTSAAVGLLVFLANDAQLRSITFWSLGSAASASWPLVAAASPPILAALLILPRHAGDLDRLLLGEAEARHLGVDIARMPRRVVALVAMAVGAAVATCGVIAFVGLVVPHVVRGWLGPSHRTLLPASALGGAALLVLADVVARLAAPPVELPIGALTALAGAPVLLMLVHRARGTEVRP
jgi:iron complex transport system permease protein